jgi:MFS transporter, ACS family, hexuronate transporter
MIGKLGAGSIFMIMAVLHPVASLLLWIMIRREEVGGKRKTADGKRKT